MKKTAGCKSTRVSLIIILMLCASFFVSNAWGVGDIQWIEGPNTAELGGKTAKITFGEPYVFCGAQDAIAIMRSMGNLADETTVGFLAPKEDDWFLLFEYNEEGYIKNADQEDLDAEAILENVRIGTEKANEYRKEQGYSPLNIVGWHTRPQYDSATNNLVWAIIAESEEQGQMSQVINYNMRLLGREGYMSVCLVADPAQLDLIKPDADELIRGFEFQKGKKYSEYVQGDKVAKYGLAALVAGGAGATAVKFGLLSFLAKGWKIIVIGVVGVFAALKNQIKRLFGMGGDSDA